MFVNVLKNVITLAKGSLNNIFQDSFNKNLSQQLIHNRSYISVAQIHNITCISWLFKLIINRLTLYHTIFSFNDPEERPFENNGGTGKKNLYVCQSTTLLGNLEDCKINPFPNDKF